MNATITNQLNSIFFIGKLHDGPSSFVGIILVSLLGK
jgi:hypothetical protein